VTPWGSRSPRRRDRSFLHREPAGGERPPPLTGRGDAQRRSARNWRRAPALAAPTRCPFTTTAATPSSTIPRSATEPQKHPVGGLGHYPSRQRPPSRGRPEPTGPDRGSDCRVVATRGVVSGMWMLSAGVEDGARIGVPRPGFTRGGRHSTRADPVRGRTAGGCRAGPTGDDPAVRRLRAVTAS